MSDESRKLNLSSVGELCRKSDFFAAKINRLRSLANISHLLTSEDVNVKIVYLVRDPRATVKSLVDVSFKKEDVNDGTIQYFR